MRGDAGWLGGAAYNRGHMIPIEEISMVLAEPAWTAAPAETDPRYFRTWQQVSLGLQRALRAWIPARYFEETVERYEDRVQAYPLVVYAACRACYGRPRTEFTYDIADSGILPAACRGIGRAMQVVLDRIAKRLYEADRPELARRYAPVWHQDILAEVQKKPKRLLRLLASEAAVINGVIDLGTSRDARAAIRFSRTATLALRTVYGMDMRSLAGNILEETTGVLERQHDTARGVEHVVDGGIFENCDTGLRGIGLARSPHAGIARDEDGDYGDAGGGGQMSDAGVVTDVHSSASEPAG